MGKLDSLRSEVDEATKKFEDCQDAYATEMFTFMSREQLYTEKLREVTDCRAVVVYTLVYLDRE